MSKRAMIAAGGVVVGLILIPLIGFLPALLVLIGLPVVAYLMLDRSQRRRLRHITRKELR
ncbi:hypothetical protein A8W25_00245 [Streptomyces sp. ERV7]|uniref:hypothetical protein n=1 Tax=Streptomyces sp. ERV7 TaxID=1322334 RepID=UPI0007F4380E|nr:hypothetical protein [Streptomyces sp. ERV7]OAR26780.1 hypothetical protein A8W25_00245 [Streptomyces sp. ERV7]